MVGRGTLQRTKMANVGPHLDVVEVGLADGAGNAQSATVPRHLKLRVFLVNVLCQHVDALGVAVATHKGEAGDVLSVFIHKGVDGICIQRKTDVLPQILAVTTRTATRAVGDVDGQRHFVGNLLKDNVGISVFEHGA